MHWCRASLKQADWETHSPAPFSESQIVSCPSLDALHPDLLVFKVHTAYKAQWSSWSQVSYLLSCGPFSHLRIRSPIMLFIKTLQLPSLNSSQFPTSCYFESLSPPQGLALISLLWIFVEWMNDYEQICSDKAIVSVTLCFIQLCFLFNPPNQLVGAFKFHTRQEKIFFSLTHSFNKHRCVPGPLVSAGVQSWIRHGPFPQGVLGLMEERVKEAPVGVHLVSAVRGVHGLMPTRSCLAWPTEYSFCASCVLFTAHLSLTSWLSLWECSWCSSARRIRGRNTQHCNLWRAEPCLFEPWIVHP